MTVADPAEDHHARCLPHLLTLRMLARDSAEAPFPWLARAKVAEATEAILAEAGAAGCRDTSTFLNVRLSRLAAAADDAIATAGAGDFPQLRRDLRRFETLTSAIWAVQDATRPAPSATEGQRHP